MAHEYEQRREQQDQCGEPQGNRFDDRHNLKEFVHRKNLLRTAFDIMVMRLIISAFCPAESVRNWASCYMTGWFGVGTA